MTRTCLRAAPAALLIMLALAGCGPQDRPLAKVGDRTITVRDFERAARAGGANYAMVPAEQGRPALLEQLVDRAMLAAAFRARGLDTTAQYRNYARTIGDQALLAAFSAQLSPIDVGASEAEARQLYAWRAVQSEVELLWAPDSTLLRRCRAQVEAGRPWAEVADQFAGAGGLPPGGALGFRQAGALPDPLDGAMRTLPVGTIGGPYATSQGWFLLRVTHRQNVPQPPFETQRTGIEQMIRQRKWQQSLMGHVAALEPEYHIVVSPAAAPTLALLLSPARMGAPLVPPTAAQRPQVLVTWDGGAYTLGDAWDDLERPGSQPPMAAYEPSIRSWVRERGLTQVALHEARRRHLDQDPQVLDRVRDQIDDYMTKTMFAELAARSPAPDDAALRAAWEPLRDRFPMLQQARIAWLTVPDSARAVAIAVRVGSGTLADAARAVAPAARVQVTTVKFPGAASEWGALQQQLESMQPGATGSPEATPEGWRVYQLVDKVQVPVDWDHLSPEMKKMLAGNLQQRGRQAQLAAYTDSLRRALNPVILADALKHAPWPSPADATP